MNQSQIHLALTHLPVVLALAGMIMLLVALVGKKTHLTTTAFYILLFAGLFALPVFFSGEGAEEMVEEMPGVSGSIIERHEDSAKLSLFAILATAVVALAGIIKPLRLRLGKLIMSLNLALAIVSSGLLVNTAHLGGQIRHTEIRNGVASVDNTPGSEDQEEEGD